MDLNEMFGLFEKNWAILTAGVENNFNTMTIGWGSLGTLWQKPVVTVYVKPIRYTHGFLEENEHFTVSFYKENYRHALGILGTLSGRDSDKVKRAGLTPRFLNPGVTFSQAHTTLLCKKIYKHSFDLSSIPQEAAENYYQGEPPHTVFIGELLEIIH